MTSKSLEQSSPTTIGELNSSIVAPFAQVDQVCPLTHDLLLIIARFAQDPGDRMHVALELADESVALSSKCFAYTQPNSLDRDTTYGRLIIGQIPSEAHIANLDEAHLSLKSASAPIRIGISLVHTDLRTLLRNSLAPLESSVRADLLEFLSSNLSDQNHSSRGQLSRILYGIREALRERLPYGSSRPTATVGISIDSLMMLDETSFYLKGHIWGVDPDTVTVRIISPEGIVAARRIGEDGLATNREKSAYPTADQVADSRRVIGCFQLPAPSRLPDGWILQLTGIGEQEFETSVPTLVCNLPAVRQMLLEDFDVERNDTPVILKHIHPALNRLQERYQRGCESESVTQYGTAPETPDISVIIPLYERIDFLEHQLCHFADDPEIRQADLIYVLDSPELHDSLRDNAEQLFRFYGLPFRVVDMKCSSGFSAVNNVGAAHACGRLLLLMNSDVFPDRPGWLGAMKDFYDSKSQIGALGVKLLYEDDSLQHAGMYFLRRSGSSTWENMHYYKGLHRGLPQANVTRCVPAVTGACLMVAAQRYKQVGGLSGRYVQGDYEDSDFCLRLAAEGFENWYLPEVELYHLEGQSYPHKTRRLAGQYNRWLHTHLWNSVIERCEVDQTSNILNAP